MCIRDRYGTENLSLIPGEVGASAVQNIGAYGVEVKDLITAVETVNIQAEERVYSVEECGYTYRNSIFKRPENKSAFVTLSLIHILFRGKIRLEKLSTESVPVRIRKRKIIAVRYK